MTTKKQQKLSIKHNQMRAVRLVPGRIARQSGSILLLATNLKKNGQK